MEEELPRREDIVAYERREFNIPDQSCLLVSAGRHVKFQDPRFWKAIVNVLAGHPEALYLVIGVEENQLPFLQSMLSQEIRNRIRFLSWKREEDYLKILILANVLIDTFPSGGGVILFDAMSLGIPVVSFRNNYMRAFDQTDWSVAEEILHPREMIVSRENLSELEKVLSKLIRDKDYRLDVGRRCQEHVFEKHSNPRRAIRKCEEIYVRVLEEKLARNPSGLEVAINQFLKLVRAKESRLF
jgi:glycosyltransferase involved in cell wall biosynthesis